MLKFAIELQMKTSSENSPMTSLSVRICAVLIMLLLPPELLKGEDSPEENEDYAIRGQVMDNNEEPLFGAIVEVHETGQKTQADTSGHFEISGLSPGSYHVHVYMAGFASTAQRVHISSNDAFINFQLAQSDLEIGEVVVEAERYVQDQRQKSLDLQVLEREEFQKHRRVSFAESLEREPGIRSMNTGQGISKPMLRGLSFHRIAVVDRGIKQEGQQWGADHGLEVDPFDMERVEIIKGPSSILYGSDASGGVINIRTPSFPAENTIRGNLNLTGASQSNLIGGSAMVEGNNNNFLYRFRYSRQDYGDYRVPADSFNYAGWIYPIEGNKLKNTAGQEETYTGAIGYRGNWGSSQLTFSRFSQRAGLFPGAFAHPGAFNTLHEEGHRSIGLPRQVTDHTKIISNSRILFEDNWLELDLGYQFNHRREEAEPHVHDNRPLPETVNHLELKLATYSGNLRYRHQHTEDFKSIYGVSGQYQDNQKDGFEFLIPQHQNWSGGVFSYNTYEWSDSLTLNAGLRYDHAQLESHSFEEPDFNSQGEEVGIIKRAPHIERNYNNLSGTLGATLRPTDELTFKANVARHFRFPRSPELAANGFHHGTFRHEQGDPDIGTETGYQMDLTGKYQTGNMLFSLTPFANYYDNYIYLRAEPHFSRFNVGQVYQYDDNTALMLGGEFLAEYHPIEPLHLELSGDYVWAQNLDEDLPLSLTPPLSIFAETEYTFPEINNFFKEPYLNINSRYLADQQRVDRNEQETESSFVINLALGNEIKLSDNMDMDLYFQVQNLLDTRYKDHLSYYRQIQIPEPGRNYQLTLEIPFRADHF